MKKVKHTILLFCCIATPYVFANTTKAQGQTYEISKHTISSGGGQVSSSNFAPGDNYTAITSIGQIDAAHNTSGGIYEFTGGFLAANNDIIFIDGFE